MQTHVNEPLLRRRLWVSAAYMVGALIFLGAGFYVSLISMDPLIQYGASIPPLLVGLVLWSRNQAYLRRWGPRTRQDTVLERGLKGLDSRYHLFVAPGDGLPDYLLVGPMGVLVIVPSFVSGTVTYANGRWQQEETRPLFLRLML